MSDRSDTQEDPPDPAQILDDQRLIRTLLRKADIASAEIVPFFDFVVREEKTQRRIVAAPHQKLFFDFVSDHRLALVRMPIQTGKTFCSAMLVTHELGKNNTTRWGLISASQAQASKPFSMVQDYIEGAASTYPELGLVFPDLRPSLRHKDPWTQTKLTIDRPPGIRDPSLVAIGIGGKLPGARLAGAVVDDILDMINTSTEAGRKKVCQWVESTVLSRRDIEDARVVVTNTPWNPYDLTYHLERAGWPSLTMGITGEITISNADLCASPICGWFGDALPDSPCPRCGGPVIIWDSDTIRPSELGRPDRKRYRLAAHDAEEYGAPLCGWKFRGKNAERVEVSDRSVLHVNVGGTDRLLRLSERRSDTVPPGVEHPHYFDVHEEIPLWPEMYSTAKIEQLKWEYRNNQAAFNQLYLCQVRDNESAKCKEEWISLCKRLGFLAGVTGFVHEYRGPNLTVTGVDLAMGQGEEHDFTALFTFEVIPSISILIPAREPEPLGIGQDRLMVLKNARRVLDVDFGRWRGRQVVDKIIDKARRFNSIARVETNAAQDFLRQWTLDVDISVPVRAHTTGANKHQRIHGVEGLFIELENGAWLIPSEVDGTVPPAMSQAIDDCLNYKPPPAHTGDLLMAWWLARAQARELDAGEADGAQGSVAASLMAR